MCIQTRSTKSKEALVSMLIVESNAVPSGKSGKQRLDFGAFARAPEPLTCAEDVHTQHGGEAPVQRRLHHRLLDGEVGIVLCAEVRGQGGDETDGLGQTGGGH